MGDAQSVAEVLERAADLIEPDGRWTRGAFSRNADGSADLDDEALAASEPVCWCGLGAIAQTLRVDSLKGRLWSRLDTGLTGQAYRLLNEVVGTDFPDWNDAPERTQAEVVAKLREAAALARTKGDAA